MPGRLYGIGLIALVALAGCSKPPPQIIRTTETIRCPTIAPPVICPEWPTWKPGQTLRELREAHTEGQIAHDRCRTAVEQWAEGWNACPATKIK